MWFSPGLLVKTLERKGPCLQRFHVKVTKRQKCLSTHRAFKQKMNFCSWKGKRARVYKTNKAPSRSRSFFPGLRRWHGVQSGYVRQGGHPFCKGEGGWGLLSQVSSDGALHLLSSCTLFCMVTLESKGIICKATVRFLSCCLCARDTEKAP